MIYDISSVANSLERISHRLDTSHDLENINKNLEYISDCLIVLCHIQFDYLQKQNSDLSKIDFVDFLRSIKSCKS